MSSKKDEANSNNDIKNTNEKELQSKYESIN